MKPEELVQSLSRGQKTLVFVAIDMALVPVALVLALLVQALPVPTAQALRATLPLLPLLMGLAGLLSWGLGLGRVALNAYGHRAMALTAALAAALAAGFAVAAAGFGPALPGGTFAIFAAAFLLASMAVRIGLFHAVTGIYRRAGPAAADPEPAPATGTAGTVLDRLDCAVVPGRSYDVLARFAGPFTPRAALARVAFEDATGNPVDPDPGTPRSDSVGHYRYLGADDRPGRARPDPNLGITGFSAPPGAAWMRIELLRWNRGRDLVLGRAEIRSHDDAGGSVVEGAADLPGAVWVTLTGNLVAAGRRDGTLAVLHLGFADAAGKPVPGMAEGLIRTGRHGNVAVIAADALGPRGDDGHGRHPLRVALRPPPGARRLTWALHPADGAVRIGLDGGLRLDTLRAAPGQAGADIPRLRLALDQTRAAALAAAPARRSQAILPGRARHGGDALDAARIDQLRSRLPADPAWTWIARHDHAVLAELALVVVPGQWFVTEATVTRAAGGLGRARLLLLPAFFDAAGARIDPGATAGCAASDTLGPHRLVTLTPEDDGGTRARLREPFRAPDGAAWALLHLVAAHADAGIAAETPSARTIRPEQLFDGLDPAHMDRDQLLQADEIARLAWDLPARRMISRALGVIGGDGGDHARRAGTLSEQLADLDTGWLPDLAPQPDFDPDPAAVLHLLKVICPEESSGGAVRSTSILQAQAAQGLRPVACLPLAAPRGDMTGRRDGIVGFDRAGVSVNFLNFPALEAQTLPPADLLSFETGLHNRVLRAHRASLIHAASGFRGYESALKGLALARANRLPMVYEVRSFHEHTWRPASATHLGDGLTRLREAQENRCMAEADAVVTISRAMEANLKGRGAAPDRLFVVPNAIGPDFETLCDQAEADALRQRHGFAGATTVGYISNFSQREGHRILLDAVTRLVAAGRDLHLVMVGDGPERVPLIQEAQRRGIAARVTMPGPVDHAAIRAWYRAIDLFVVPRIADFASDYVTPLKPFEAMSQLVPVIMSDRPVTPEIAGSGEARAGIFAAGDPAALVAAITHALSDRDALAARAQAARDWVLRERVWASVVRRYDAVYAAARAEHARRDAMRRAG